MKKPQIVKVQGSQYAHLTQPRNRSETVCLMDHEGEPADNNQALCPFCERDTRLNVR